MWRQGVRLPLRSAHVRVVQRLFQADRAKQKGVHVRGRAVVSHRQDPKEAVSVLPVPEMSRSRHETRRLVSYFLWFIIFY